MDRKARDAVSCVMAGAGLSRDQEVGLYRWGRPVSAQGNVGWLDDSPDIRIRSPTSKETSRSQEKESVCTVP